MTLIYMFIRLRDRTQHQTNTHTLQLIHQYHSSVMHTNAAKFNVELNLFFKWLTVYVTVIIVVARVHPVHLTNSQRILPGGC